MFIVHAESSDVKCRTSETRRRKETLESTSIMSFLKQIRGREFVNKNANLHKKILVSLFVPTTSNSAKYAQRVEVKLQRRVRGEIFI